jgi:hypothetical protein
MTGWWVAQGATSSQNVYMKRHPEHVHMIRHPEHAHMIRHPEVVLMPSSRTCFGISLFYHVLL